MTILQSTYGAKLTSPQPSPTQEHIKGEYGFWQIRSKTTTNAIISSQSIPGLISRLNTSSLSTTDLLAFLRDISAATSPDLLRILQFRLQKQPSIWKSGVLLLPMNTSTSSLLFWRIDFRLIEKIWDLDRVFAISSVPLNPFHWSWMLKTCSNETSFSYSVNLYVLNATTMQYI